MKRWEVTMLAEPPLKTTWVVTRPPRVEVVEAAYLRIHLGCAIFRNEGSATSYPKTVAVFPVHAFQSIIQLKDGV